MDLHVSYALGGAGNLSFIMNRALLCTELEHLKIETRLTIETSVSEMGEYASVR